MTESADESPRLTQKLWAAAHLAVFVTIVAVVVVAVVAANRIMERSNEMYAKWHMGDLLVDYLRDNDNQWPDSWEQLEDRFDDYFMGGYSYEEIQTLLCVDFSVSEEFICNHLEEIRAGKIKLVWSRSGDDSHYEGAGSNEIIADYFQHVCSQKDAHDNP